MEMVIHKKVLLGRAKRTSGSTITRLYLGELFVQDMFNSISKMRTRTIERVVSLLNSGFIQSSLTLRNNLKLP